ncbi:MAG: bifunctional 4-hydroxy-3-methylbut-2-enyl diphosphate reductase/30S ribosomal protein S1 [Clostridia bacterium]|nr:bifunctional 4-hydroxy-3-methylbut-2-enyl diphosphate reductase/30S ribosomal protein S1 [Clostridia bacterium]
MVIVSEHAGFCFGVRRATDLAEELIAKTEKNSIICTLGKLIHNESYTRYLAQNGIVSVDGADIDSLYARAEEGYNVTLILRTHGVERELKERLEGLSALCPRFKVVDCACPYVKKIHKIAYENSGENKIFILIGQKNHPEVTSIVSYCLGEYHIFLDSEQLEEYLKTAKFGEKQVIMSAQTTQNLKEWKKCQEILKKYCTNEKIFDTICSVTEKRQTEAEELCQRVDAMLVIGGRDSSNTAKLYHICHDKCPKTFWIQTKDDIPFDKIGNSYNIGITAGASTPDSLIQEVKKSMGEIMENFAELLAEAEADRVKIYKGATVKGTVMSISETEIRLDLGAKSTGVITRDNMNIDNAAKLCEVFKIGDEVEAKVEATSDVDGIITLSKKAVDDVKNWEKIVEYAEQQTVVEAKIVRAVKGGVIANVDGAEIFVPASMTGLAKDEDLSKLAGTVQKMKIVEIKDGRKKAIGSIKIVAREERKAALEAFWASIEEGKVYEGPVKSITSYGAFVDIGGVDGLVHITELSWNRIKHPSEVVKVGDVVKVFVKSFDKEAKKVSLGYKTEEENPWNIFTSKYAVDDVAEVKIVGVTSFGAFAEVVPGVDGLIHISQIADKKIDSVANVLKVGDVVEAKIVGIDEENHKVSLSIRVLLAPAEAEDAE